MRIFKKIQDRINDLMNSGVALTSGASAGWLLHRHLARLDQNQLRKLAERTTKATKEIATMRPWIWSGG